MTETFIRRMRWKAFYFLHPDAKPEVSETYGFNSTRAPPTITEMQPFENKMENLIRSIEFRDRKNKFQNELKKKVKQITKDDRIFVKADKTSNYYKIEPKEYKSLLSNTIQVKYKKTNPETASEINKEAKKIATNFKIENRVDKLAEREAFITFKDHKENFQNKPTCRLINPAKSELGRASKKILQKVVTEIRNVENLNLWRSTKEVIDWFKIIEKSSKTSFIVFDIVDFYPSITEELLDKALKFATGIVPMTTQEIEVIKHTKKALLFAGGELWKKASPENFDVTMGSYDGAETCEIVGLFILSELQKDHGNEIGLYRDDGLAVLQKTPREVENIKKKMCELFKKHNLKITIEANKKVINYLDITLDLAKNTYKPYKKPNDVPLYINYKSNHPPMIKKNVPKGINKRLSTISATKTAFDEATKEYQQALKESGYRFKLQYEPEEKEEREMKTDKSKQKVAKERREEEEKEEEANDEEKEGGEGPQNRTDERNNQKMKNGKKGKEQEEEKEQTKKPKRMPDQEAIKQENRKITKEKRRKRNIIWFNPPYEGTTKTNIGKEFLKIIDESFPKSHKLHKIFNRNTIKLSYSCMTNLKQIIESSNKKKIRQSEDNHDDNTRKKDGKTKSNCNCRKSDQCPLQNNCQINNIIYQATVTEEDTQKTETYIGMTETPFKTRYANHKQSFNHEKYRHQTELSKHVWRLKEKNTKYKITWKVIQKAKSYSPSSKKCNLCTTEKFYILCKPTMATLNTRIELISNCRHRKKHLLNEITDNDPKTT